MVWKKAKRISFRTQSLAASWHTGVSKTLERQFAAFVPESAAILMGARTVGE